MTVLRATTVSLVLLLTGGCGSDSRSDDADDPETTTTEVSEPETTTTEVSEPETSQPVAAGARVTSVVDGDTIEAEIDGQAERVRLIGMNAPESDECLADEATARLTELVGGQDVRLMSDVSDRDQYGRLLRYVFVGDTFVNRQLVEEGLAIARRYPPDEAHADELDAAQARARDAQLGIWSPGACGPVAAGDLRIGAVQTDPPGDDTLLLNEEWVEIVNSGDEAVDLDGWMLRDESASNRFDFPAGFVLAPGVTVRIRSGCGTDSPTDLHWCAGNSAIWNNSGDTVFLLDPSGNIAASRTV